MASLLVGQPRKDFWTLSFGQFLMFCGFFSFFQFPLYILSVGGGEVEIGIIMGVTSLASTLLLPWIIAAVDRLERRRMMLFGLVMVGGGTMACYTSTAPDAYMGFLMLTRGLGFAIYMNASGSYIAAILPPLEKARWIGINFGFNQIAIGLGPLMGELIIRDWGFFSFFLMSTIFVFAGLVLILFITARAPPPPEKAFQPMDSLVVFFRELFGARYRNSFFTLLLLAGALGAVFNFTATYTLSLGLSSGIFFSTYALLNVICRFFGAGIADRFDRWVMVVPNLLIMAGGLMVYSFIGSTPTMIFAAVLIGIGFGLSNPAILAKMLDRSPVHLQGMAIGLFHFAYQFGLLGGAPLFGLAADAWGYPSMWWISTVLVVLSAVIFVLPDSRKIGVAAAPQPASTMASVKSESGNE